MKKKKKTTSFLKDEEDIKEIQLLEAVQNRAILEPLEKQGLSLGELQSKLEQTKNIPVKKSTLAHRISRLRTAGLVRKQYRQIHDAEKRSPKYRGWRIKQQENGTYSAELGFEITKNGESALKTIRTFTEQKTDLPRKEKKQKMKKKEGR
ncbi:MAG: hypothetical protein HWN65_09195 [Candidatus Helarchaeota archaeon]|nr:hypothetical protein [Candidatus Helarchaeota archaeon]